MKMTVQQFHNSSCCHQENNGLSNCCNIYSPSSSSIDVLKHMDSLSITPTYHVYSSQNICYCGDNIPVKGHMGISYVINCPCGLEEDARNCEVGDHFSMGSESIDEFGENSAAVSMEDIRRRICMNEGNPGDCFLSGKNVGQSKVCARGHWKPAEDSKLKELVALYGPQNWNLIAEKLQGRTGKSCRLRWFNQLDPRINKKAFSEEEEERLMTAHKAYGNKWAMIARLFPGRTDNAVKNQWHVIMARKYREQASAYRRRKLSQAIQRKMEENGNLNCREAANGNNTNSPKNPTVGSNGSYNKTSRKGAATCVRDLFLGSKRHSLFSPGEGACRNQTPLDFFSDYIRPESFRWNSRQWNMLYDETTLTVSHPYSHPSQMIMQQSSNHQLSGFSDSIASASQVTVTETSSSSPLAAEKTAASHLETTASPPPFIDFLGVGPSCRTRLSKPGKWI